MTGKTTLRELRSVEEVEYFQNLERLIWQSPPEDVVPTHVAITVIRNGGGLIAAFDDDGPAETGGMVGLVFWFPGLGVPTTSAWRPSDVEGGGGDGAQPAPILKMCSHMAGVLPDWQGRGLGAALKFAQRDAIRTQGMTDWVTWTYDPLFRTNAVFNIRRLGAVCNTYRRDWYGVMKDGLNAGVPSDRCQVDWWLASERVAGRGASVHLEGSPREGERRRQMEAPPDDLIVLPTKANGAVFRAPVELDVALDGRPIALPIPDDIAAIRRADPPLGMAWRLYVRHHLEQTFDAGYVMTDCLNLAGEWHYLLEHRSESEICRDL